ncbi:hypothetical protein [Primorskyibacter sp. S187A]|uniref:hypothetical protein n=1 Tax=Primorskyibacter sp. S187A TaxID=3415130 RepID=UPI003C79E27A
MTLITPEQDRETLDQDVEQIRSVLKELKDQFEDLRQQVRSGEVETVKEAGKTLSELRSWMRTAMETEKQLDDYLKRENGTGPKGYALDLAEAKRQIGCRLGRIAPCCKA